MSYTGWLSTKELLVKKAPKHPEEAKRLDTLREYDILDTLPEQNYDDLTELASLICGTEIALVSLVDDSRQWFKSRHGLDAEETERDVAFCAHAIHQDAVFEVPDTHKDDRFRDNPLVTEGPKIRFYAGAPIYGHNGMPLGTLCVIDSEPNKLTSAERSALRALSRQVMSQLELRRNVKQLATAQKTLEEKNKTLEELAKYRSDFINHVSHEIRTPLNAILGFSRVLSNQEADARRHELSDSKMLEILKVSAENLSDIVNHVLDISRLEAGKMNLQEHDIVLKEFIDDLVLVNAERAKSKSITLSCEVSESLPKIIRIDKAKLLQILMNLLGNAYKFTPEGKSVLLSIEREEDTVLFSIKDEGVGISKDDLEKIFVPFEQIKNRQGEMHVGSGLGLTICKQLTEFLGGDISVESKLAKGSTFTVRLPLVEGELANVIDIGKTVLPKLERKCVLVVEDNRVNQLVLQALLSKTQINIEFAETARSGFELADSRRPDILLIDLRLPDGSGFDLIERLNQQPELKAIPKVIISGDVSKATIDKAQQLGVDEFLEKPIDEHRLIEVLARLLGES